MPKKLLEDWVNVWNTSSGTDVEKTQTILKQYVHDSEHEFWGFTYSNAWSQSSNHKNLIHSCAPLVKKSMTYVTFKGVEPEPITMEELLGRVREKINFIPDGDELLLVLHVIKHKTGIDYASIYPALDEETQPNYFHV